MLALFTVSSCPVCVLRTHCLHCTLISVHCTTSQRFSGIFFLLSSSNNNLPSPIFSMNKENYSAYNLPLRCTLSYLLLRRGLNLMCPPWHHRQNHVWSHWSTGLSPRPSDDCNSWCPGDPVQNFHTSLVAHDALIWYNRLGSSNTYSRSPCLEVIHSAVRLRVNLKAVSCFTSIKQDSINTWGCNSNDNLPNIPHFG